MPKRSTITVLTATALAVLAAVPAQASFGGNPGKLAFMQGDVGATTPYGIATANPDGTLQMLVGPTCQEGSTAPCAANASWSRDGQRIAFDRGGAIRTMDADGTDRETFTVAGLFALARPAYDPSGTNIAFQGVDRDGKRDIHIRNLISGAVRRLTFAGGAEPAWSSDGRIAFTRAGNIYVINADGSAKRRITGKGGVQADWSPDSQRLIFVRGGNVYRVNQDAKDLKKLTGKTGYEPVWQTDGSRVLFHRNASGNRTIYSVNLSAADLRLQVQGVEGRGRNVFSVSQQPLP